MENKKAFHNHMWCVTFLIFLLSVSCHYGIAQQIIEGENAQQFFGEIPDNFKRQIERAIPVEVVINPKQSRKLLVFDLTLMGKELGHAHPSIPYANYAIYKMGEQTGAYETYFSKDTLLFTREILDGFDAILLNNTTGVLFDDPGNRQALLDYVYAGGGIMGIHGGAGATFVQYPVYDQFPAFGEMMGGYENGGHPWKTHEWINLEIEEANHPLNKGFIVRDFDVSDEIYQFADHYSRDKVRVLLSVNKDKTDMGDHRHFLPARKMDDDFPVSWVKSYGKGRVFCNALGHHPHINWDQRILQHNFRAIQFVLGDLPAFTTPNNKITASVRAQERLGWRLGLTAYTFKDLTLLETIDKAAELGIWYLDGLNVQKVSSEVDKDFDYKLSKEELLMVRQKLLDKGVAISNYYIHDIPADEKVCRQIFEFGRLMGIEAFIAEPKPEALPMIDEFCREYQIKLAIHNHGPDISPDYWNPEKLLKVVEDRSSWIGACADIGYWQRNGIDPQSAIKKLDQRLITIQVHDLNEISKEGHDLAWGTGKTDLKTIFELISSLELQPTLIGLEYSYNWGNSMPDIIQSKAFFDQTVINIAAHR